MKNGKRQRTRRAPLIEALEPRILFSADVFAGAIDNPADDDSTATLLEQTLAEHDRQTAERAGQTDQDPTDQLSQSQAYPNDDATAVAADSLTPSDSVIDDEQAHTLLSNDTVRKELVLIDPATPDYQLLLDDLLGNNDDNRQIDIVLLDADRNGIDQLSAILGSYTDLDAVHLVSHGSAGAVALGNSSLDFDSLLANASSIKSWSGAFSANGDLLIYGCDLAASEDGHGLVDALSRLTGADVAASDDITGHASLGGDWDLEYSKGDIETQLIASQQFQSDWEHVLDVAVNSTSTGVSTGGNFTVSHTVSGTDRLMLVGVTLNLAGANSVDSISYNGDAFSLVGTETDGDAAVEIWSLLNPDVGTYDVDIVINGTSDGNTAAVMSFTGVDQSTPLGTFGYAAGVGGSGSVSVSSTTDDLVFGLISVDDPTNYDLVHDAAQTEDWDLYGYEINSSGGTKAGEATPVDMSWTWSGSDSWAAAGVSVIASPNSAPVLWMSTDSNVGAPGADGLESWNEGDVLQFGGAYLNHGDATDGDLSLVFDFDTFTLDTVDTGALHFVSQNMTVGGINGTFDLQAGDVLVSFLQDETIKAAYSSSGSDMLVDDQDLLLFRPNAYNDYSTGTFYTLLDDVVADDLKGVTLIERDTTIGGTDVDAGSFLIISEVSATTSVDLFVPTGVGVTTTTGSVTPFIDLSNLGIDADRLRGIEVIETAMTIGGQVLAKGDILATLNVDDNVSGVGSNNLLVDLNDVFVLSLTATGQGTTAGTAAMFLDGSDVGLDNNPSQENPYALALFDYNDAPVLTGDLAATVAEGGSYTLTTTDLGYTDADDVDAGITFSASSFSNGKIQVGGVDASSFTGTQLVAGDVTFVHDGSETTTAAFDVNVEDGDEDNSTPTDSTFTFSVTPGNDAPVLNNASLTVTEGETVAVSAANFDITDPEDSDFTYSVSGVSGGYFQLSSAAGTPVTSFTSTNLSDGLVQFVDDGNEVAPAFSVTVNDGDVDSNTVAASITYSDDNDAPVLNSAALTVTEGETVAVSAANFGITDPDDSDFTYTVSGVSGGYFQLSDDPGTPVTSFSSTNLSDGLVQFVDDGNEVAPAFSVTVNDGDVDSNTVAAAITYTDDNDAPVLNSAALTVSEGETVAVSATNFGITDPDDTDFTYTVSSISGGYFQLSDDPGTPVTSFTSTNLSNDLVQFVDDSNEVAPAFSITVNDGDVDSNTVAAAITYTDDNDAPVLNSAALTVSEGETVAVSATNFGITDPDDTDFTYTVSSISGGFFQLSGDPGTPVTSFSSTNLSDGLVQFIDDGNEVAPAFSVTVNDGNVDSNTVSASITYSADNDAPTLDSAALTVTEGDTVAVSAANFGITDPDDTDFTYTASGVSGGYFQLSSAAGTPITSFTSINLSDGLVQFVDDGNEVAPAFSVTVNDGDVDSNTLAATVTYSDDNDAPVLDSASLAVTEGETVDLSAANFGITDPDDTDFTYTVSGISGGYFQLSDDPGTPVTSFSSTNLSDGLVQFVDDGNEVAPAFSVTANDGDVDSNTLAATVTYSDDNDAPVLNSAALTVSEGETVNLSAANFDITDPEDSDFTYTVSAVSGGYFQLSSDPGTPVTSFTSTNLSDGLVQFVDDGNEVAPLFSVTVNDGDVDSNTLAASITYSADNDAPVLNSAALTVTEGETIDLSAANFGITDPDDSDFTYTVSGVSGGYFQLSGDPGTPVTSFTSTNLSDGLVQFVDDGNEVAPLFSVTVNDGDVDSNTVAASITYSADNDAPVLNSAALTVTEGETINLSAANFGITDPDDSDFTYTVSGISGGYFQLSGDPGTPVTSFSSTNLSDGLVQFVDDGNEVAPAFSVTANDGDVDSNTVAASITYTDDNDAPVLNSAALTVSEGETVAVSATNFGITDPDDTDFTYTVSSISGGYFQLSGDPGTPVTSFSSTNLSDGLVQFVDDGNEVAPAFSVNVNDGDVDSNTVAAAITYTDDNDAPTLDSAALTVSEGEIVAVSATNFGITDPDDSDFTYTVSGISGGYFQLSDDPGTPVTSFSSTNLSDGLVQFVDDGNEVAPLFSVTVNDGDVDSNTVAAAITYTDDNDAPVLNNAALTVSEGETVAVSAANFGITDPDDTDFTYSVSGVSGGYFQLSSAAGTPITSFTSTNLSDGLVQFVDDSNEVAPAFSITVNDGDVDSNTVAASITYTDDNDAPVLNSAALTVSEGETVAVSATNFGITDPDDTDFTYTVSSISGGYFQLSGDPGTPVTSFSSTNLSDGLVQFVDDGNEVAPAFSVNVNDGDVDSNTVAAAITYTDDNDAPTLDSAALTVSKGEIVAVSATNFGITDPDDSDFTYTVSGISGGYFQLSDDPGTPVTSFSSTNLSDGLVQFVDDGNEVAPLFSVTVNDGDVDSNTVAAAITYTDDNDAPVLNNAALTVSEGETVAVSAANFGITDPDDTDFTYSVSGVSGGYFQLSSAAGTPITSFTSTNLSDGLVQFVDDGNEVAPAFSVTVNDGDVDSNTLAATVTYSDDNDAPVLDSAALTVSEGETVDLSAANFGITDPDDTDFTYTVSGISGGYFQLSDDPGTPVTSFSSTNLSDGLVQFVDDGNEVAPLFSVTVNDGDVDSNTVAATVTYSADNDAPVLNSAALTVSEGETVAVSAANFGITDPDDTDFTYTVSGVSGGYFQLSDDPGTPVTSFSSTNLSDDLVQFVDDGNEVAPAFSITVNDGDVDSNTVAAAITYTDDNDAPVLNSAALTVTEGETVAVSATNFGITDHDDTDFTYTVSGISGGYFQLSGDPGTPVTSFSSTNLSDGLVQFIDDGNEVAPLFSVTVNDGDVDSNTVAATVTYSADNDAPVLNSAALTVSEGETVAVSAANFGITDPDDTDFTYTVSGVSGGYFQLNNDPGTPITSFSSTNLSDGLVQFVDDGNEVPPAFSVTVNDGDVDSNTVAATVTYSDDNDAPVLNSAALTVSEGEPVAVSAANFGITDPDDSDFTYSVSGVSGGYFQLSDDPGTPVTSFSSTNLSDGLVQFVDDGNEVAPAFSVTVNDGDVDSNTLAATVTYSDDNDAPVLNSAALTVTEGETVAVSAANFGITDPDDTDFTYTVSGVSGGYFQLSDDPGTPVTSFTSTNLSDGLVQFVDDGNEVAPLFSVTVNDGDVDSNTVAATVTYSADNDAPVLNSAALTVSEGETINLSAANFGITDPDDTDFTYTVSGISGGYFQLSDDPGTPVTSFTSTNLSDGLVQFVDDGNEVAPAFSVTVNDGDVDSNTLAATVTYSDDNDAPVLDSAALTVSEGETVAVSATNFGITDPDDTDFTYTVSGISGGYFQLSDDPGTPVTSFSSTNLSDGLVHFVDDGNEVAPAFSVTVNDGDVDSNTLAASIIYSADNDAPVLNSAALTVTEGETVAVSATNFGITDPDDTDFTYTVSGVSGGYFQLSDDPGTPVTSFSSTNLSDGLVQFVDDGNEVAPAFSVTVNDGDVDSNTVAASITYTDDNDAPVLNNAALTVSEGETVAVSATNFGITDPDDTDFTYTVSSISGGYFQLSGDAGTPITSFSSTNLSDGLVQFVDDGNEVAPAFSVTVNDGDVDSNTVAASITYTDDNDAPVLNSAALTVSEGETVAVSATNFGITDPDDTDFTYTVSGVSGGYFQLNNDPGTPITSFSSTNLSDGLVQFVDDGNEVPPAFSVTVNDGDVDSNTVAASITYTDDNDAPVLNSAALTVTEGETVAVSATNFGITDPDDTDFTYTVSGISGGYFQLSGDPGTPVTSFSSTNLSDGLVQFIDDGNEVAPAFSVTVNDGDVDSNTVAASITYTDDNDAPVLNSAALTVTEGETVAVSATNFGITDPDDTDFTYTASGVSGGYFQLSDDAGTPITSFTSTNLNDGLVQFVDDGNEVAPAFSVTVNDGDVDSNTVAAAITYTDDNDAPVLNSAALTVTEGDTVAVSAANFGITDPDDTDFTYTVSGISGGYFQLSGDPGTPVTSFSSTNLSDGLVQFIDDGNEVAPAFSVTVNDGDVDSNTLAATITYSAANDAPTGTDKTVTTNEDTDYTFASVDFGFSDNNDSPANDLLNVIITTAPANGILYIDSDNDGLVDDSEVLADSAVVSATDISVERLKFKPTSDAYGSGYDSFTFKVQDDGGVANGGVNTDQSANTITINLTAQPDAANIGGDTAGAVSEDGTLSDSGTLTINDPDAGEAVFIAQSAAASTDGYGTVHLDTAGNWTYTLSNADATVQALSDGDTLTDSFTASSADGTTQVISVTINGAKDAATIGGVNTGAVTKNVDPDSDTLLETEGALTIADVDAGESSFIAESISGRYGVMVITSAGDWNYSADNNQTAIQALGVNEILTDTFTVTASEGTSHIITIRIIGQSDSETIVYAPPKFDDSVDRNDNEPTDNSEPTDNTKDNDKNDPDDIATSPEPKPLPTEKESPPADDFLDDNPTPVVLQPLDKDFLAALFPEPDLDTKKDDSNRPDPKYIDLNNLDLSSYKSLELPPLEEFSIINNDSFIKELDQLREDLDNAAEFEKKQYSLGAEARLGIAMSLSAGFVSWALRAGSLFASAMTVLPLWKQLDLLPIVSHPPKKKQGDDVDQTDDRTNENSTVEEIFQRDNTL